MSLVGQEQLEHKMKWHVGKDGKFYTNKHLPVYIRLAHSPEDGAESHLLTSESTKKYANPMYFDTEGHNTLRSPSAVDTVTKEIVLPKFDIMFDVYPDGIAPASKIKFVDAPRYKDSKGIVFYGADLKINLSSFDKTSGVESIYYSVNGDAYKEYNNNFSIDTEGDYVVKYYAVDNVGNVEKPISIKFTVDLTFPSTKHTVNGEITNDVISPKASIILTTEDALSGVNRVMYYFNNNKPKRYTKPIALSHLKDGKHSIRYYAIDNVENSSKSKDGNKYDFYLDKSVPFASASVEGDQFSGKFLYISERSKIKLASTDNKGGDNIINYGINKSAKSNLYETPFSIPNNKGIYYVNYIATDNVKNVTPNNVFKIYMDNVKPVTSIIIGNPKFLDRDTLFVTKDSKVQLIAVDHESGIKKVVYNVNGEAYKTYSEFTLKSDGLHKILYKSTDNVNNEGKEKTQEIVVDNNSPEIFAYYSVNTIGNETKDGKSYPIYPTYTRIFLAASDKYSGTQKLLYSINGGYFRNYLNDGSIAQTDMVKKEGFYEIIIKASDKLGNESKKTLKFFTRNHIPK